MIVKSPRTGEGNSSSDGNGLSLEAHGDGLVGLGLEARRSLAKDEGCLHGGKTCGNTVEEHCEERV